MRYLVEASKTK